MPIIRRLAGSRHIRRLGYFAGFVAAGWLADEHLNYSTFGRNLRTLFVGALVTLDYKLNFVPGKAESIGNLHQRVANRVLEVCQENGGLYIKFGQQIAGAGHILPPQYFHTFRQLYDNAPTIPYKVVKKIFAQEFDGKSPQELFLEFDVNPVASASIAQVHKAKLKDGTLVAVKVQKPEIRHQIGWDLFTHRLVITAFEFFFDLPLVWTADYIKSHLLQETDFLNEGRNAEKAAKYVNQVPSLARHVYIPKVFWEYSTPRILVCEWIDGFKFDDVESIENAGLSVRKIMTTTVEVFADQIFREGFVHCDPHPGNLIVRKHPQLPNTHQIVLLDHGLYVQASEAFRHNYAVFWKSLFTGDIDTVTEIATSWGIHDAQMFASATLQRPWKPGQMLHVEQKTSVNNLFQSQLEAKKRVKHFLSNTEKVPKELIFVGRNLNIIRSNNKALGSPVNRISIMANWAVKSLGNNWSVWTSNSTLKPGDSPRGALARSLQLPGVVQARINYWRFQSMLFFMSLGFFAARVVQNISWWVFGIRSSGFEDLIDSQFKSAMKDQFGIELDPAVFDA
ncbi:ABC1 family-domain-containing protein [Polychytrium aggregatum]|uniref:ABC1 family-domain-containing protein n=1 Tax=Polychytrium aggregatum TaxID=110093 RepID=UPI0022FF23DA|nr:ABC1 family-domain-containing protein [Polychytrium aggregatum]KAI9208141.1 ABC1 family-domain-containing protein [Polychytrium aggregatum]